MTQWRQERERERIWVRGDIGVVTVSLVNVAAALGFPDKTSGRFHAGSQTSLQAQLSFSFFSSCVPQGCGPFFSPRHESVCYLKNAHTFMLCNSWKIPFMFYSFNILQSEYFWFDLEINCYHAVFRLILVSEYATQLHTSLLFLFLGFSSLTSSSASSFFWFWSHFYIIHFYIRQIFFFPLLT